MTLEGRAANRRTETATTRRRGAELEAAILGAAWDVLVELGYPGFTYEAVAARAGTSRAVLYRRWARREDLLLAALEAHWASHPIPVPDTGSLRDDAIAFLRGADVGRARMVMLISVQIVDYFRADDTNFAGLRDTVGGGRPPFEQIVARAVERGELPGTPLPPRVMDLAFDLYRHEVFMTMHPVPDETIVEIVDLVWLPLLAAHTGAPVPRRAA